jgi:predicted phosphodiesterase
MPTFERLTEVFDQAEEIPFDDSSRIILFSDCHRGDNSWADDFAHNQSLVFFALEYYHSQGFTYIELGDGDELWENRRFGTIRRAHSHVFWMMREFYRAGRLYLIYGNHDLERKYPAVVERTLYRYYDERLGRYEPLFEGIEVHEGLILRHWNKGYRLFLTHGHQGDPINDHYWYIGRFLSRYVWRNLQLLGVNDRTSPAKNYKKRKQVEERLIEWARLKNQTLICGHTHRPRFPGDKAPPFFNTGSCVHPRSITGIEIVTGTIALIKWWIRPWLEQNGALYVTREVLVGPKSLDLVIPDRG